MNSPLSTVCGESATYRLSVVDGDNAAVDISGWTLYFTVKKFSTDAEPLIYKTSGNAAEIVITDGEAGLAEVYVTPSDTEDLCAGRAASLYFFDLWGATLDSKLKTIVKASSYEVTPRITVLP